MSDALHKPDDPGESYTAIARLRGAYLNVRQGPGLEYVVRGQLRPYDLVRYFPDTLHNEWLWVEGVAVPYGWVHSSYIAFEEVNADLREIPPAPATPYDGNVAYWYWKGSGIVENTLKQMLANIQRNTPNVRQIFVKTSDGSHWMGKYDYSELAINGPESIDRWVGTLTQQKLEFHAWCVPRGLELDAETALIIETCRRPGVRSLILDVEPYTHYWQGGAELIRPYMLRLREALGADFHIGMSVDPRAHHYQSIFPEAWYPFVDSIHPQVYWQLFRTTPEDALTSCYKVWGEFGRPIYPVLQADATAFTMKEAYTLATFRHGARGLSWWRYGVANSNVYAIIDRRLFADGAEGEMLQDAHFGDEQIIHPESEGYEAGSYAENTALRSYLSQWGWRVDYATTRRTGSVLWAQWAPHIEKAGEYEIAVFVPTRHATTSQARYLIRGVENSDGDVTVDVDQTRLRNQWQALGIFPLPARPGAGGVFLNDVTGEPKQEIAFTAIRWRRVIDEEEQEERDAEREDYVGNVRVADGYDSPVGTSGDRHGERLWPRGWLDASPFGKLYFLGTPRESFHTGADLNWGRGPDDDLGQLVHACAHGVVTFAAPLPVFGNVIVIRHDPLFQPEGLVIRSRYAHVQRMRVQTGQRVSRGDVIAEIGDAFGAVPAHLHFDLSPTDRLESQPSDWPGRNKERLLRDYVDPKAFTVEHRPRS